MKKYSCARCGKGRTRYRTPSPFKVMAAERAKRDKIYAPLEVQQRASQGNAQKAKPTYVSRYVDKR
ncbi:hypothetical protein HZB93_01995 [Candidatus Falkowbacteria bacterium]|nr:hypothetical protein [Candidatus Falkowbacteria bacterium]